MLRPQCPSQSSGLRFPFELSSPLPATCRGRHPPPENEYTYVVTRSRPYPYQVLAASGWRLGTQRHGLPLPIQPSLPPSVICHRFSHLPRTYPLHLIHSALHSVLNAVLHSVPYLFTAASRSTRSATRSAPPASPRPSTEAFHFFQTAQSPEKASAMILRADSGVSP